MDAPFLAKALEETGTQDFCLDVQVGINRTLPHWHSCLEIIFMRRGQAAFFFDDRWITLAAGDMLVIPPGQVHCCDCRQAIADKVVVGLSERLLQGCDNTLVLPLHMTDIHRLCLFRQEAALKPHVDRLVHLADTPQPRNALLCAAELLQIYAHIYGRWQAVSLRQSDPKCRDMAMQIQRMILANPADAPTAVDMAGRMHISYSYMCRILRDNLHQSYTGLVNLARIEEARRQLLTTDRSLTRIATDCGFCDTAYFIKLFRRYTGCTPKTFRALHQT